MATNVEITILLDFYGEMLTEKQRDFLGYYYNDDLSLSEIAENEGITRQGVRDAIKRAETLLYEMESKLGFAKRLDEIKATLHQIMDKKKKHTKEPTPKHQASPLLYSIEIKDVNAAVPGILQPQYISIELGGGRALQVAKMV